MKKESIERVLNLVKAKKLKDEENLIVQDEVVKLSYKFPDKKFYDYIGKFIGIENRTELVKFKDFIREKVLKNDFS